MSNRRRNFYRILRSNTTLQIRENLMRTAMLASLAMFCLAAQVAAEKPTAKVIGLEINKKLPAEQRDVSFAFRDGTTVGVLLTTPGKRIVDVDVESSKLERYVDDKDFEMVNPKGEKPRPGEFATPWLEGFPRISKDGQHCLVNLRSPRTPSENASKVLIKASVALQVGSDPKTEEFKDTALKPGDKIKLGNFTLQVPKEQFGGGTSLSIISDQPNVGSVVFLDAEGKEIKSFPGGSSKTGIFGKSEYHTYFGFEKKVEKATIQLTYYSKIEKIEVPIDIQIGIGF